jgi:hypothetical protein
LVVRRILEVEIKMTIDARLVQYRPVQPHR